MILHVVGFVLASYFVVLLTMVLIGTIWLSVKTELAQGDTLSKIPEFMDGYDALRSVAWRWPIVMPVALVAGVGIVIGVVVGTALRSLRRAYRRIVG